MSSTLHCLSPHGTEDAKNFSWLYGSMCSQSAFSHMPMPLPSPATLRIPGSILLGQPPEPQSGLSRTQILRAVNRRLWNRNLV